MVLVLTHLKVLSVNTIGIGNQYYRANKRISTLKACANSANTINSTTGILSKYLNTWYFSSFVFKNRKFHCHSLAVSHVCIKKSQNFTIRIPITNPFINPPPPAWYKFFIHLRGTF